MECQDLGVYTIFRLTHMSCVQKALFFWRRYRECLLGSLRGRLRACSLSFHSRKALMLTRAYAPQVFFLREVLVATFLLMRINQGVLHVSHMKFANDITDDWFATTGKATFDVSFMAGSRLIVSWPWDFHCHSTKKLYKSYPRSTCDEVKIGRKSECFGGFPSMGDPQNGLFTMENPIHKMDGGSPISGNLYLLTHNCMCARVLCLSSASSVAFWHKTNALSNPSSMSSECKLAHIKTSPKNETGRQI